MPSTDLWWVYLIRCVDGRFYVGMSGNLTQRIEHHRHGQAALFTRQHTFQCVVGAVPIGDRRQAGRFERKVKCWPAERKKNFFRLFPLIQRIVRSEDVDTLWKALAIQASAMQDPAHAEIRVWQAVKLHSPELCQVIMSLGWNDIQAARWICHHADEIEGTPAHLVAKNKTEEVLALVLRSVHGVG